MSKIEISKAIHNFTDYELIREEDVVSMSKIEISE